MATLVFELIDKGGVTACPMARGGSRSGVAGHLGAAGSGGAGRRAAGA
jgi:hypothetical protein